MANSFDPKYIENYKSILNNISEIEKNIDNYVNHIISDTYKAIEEVLVSNVDKIIASKKKQEQSHLYLNKYVTEQTKYTDKCLEIIDTHKYENLSLYASFDEIKKNFLKRKNFYENFLKNDKLIDSQIVSNFYSIKNNLKYFEIKYLSFSNKFVSMAFEILKEMESSQLIKILYSIKQDIIEIDKENFYLLYKKSMAELEIDKPFTSNYKDFINEDMINFKFTRDILANFELSFISFSDSDMEAIDKLSSCIMNMFHSCEKYVNELKDQEIETLIETKLISKENFINSIAQSNLLIVSEKKTFEDFKIFVDIIENNLKDLEKNIFNFVVKNNINQETDVFLKQINFANDLLEMFNSIIIYTENIKEMKSIADTNYEKIIRGIDETLKIKVSTIKEKVEQFENDIVVKMVELDEEAKANILKIIFSNFIKDNDIGRLELLHKILNDENTKYLKITMNEVDYGKEIFKIKKDCILYEICTFEEIINHSVMVLRGCLDQDVIVLVNFMDIINEKIDALLKTNNISKIFPKIHEKFNSKEHVVLVAEKNAKFAKGEIIKVITAGFKENENVIIKSNIIAAK